MGLFGSSGLKSAAASVSQIIASLLGQDIVANSFRSTKASASAATPGFRSDVAASSWAFAPTTAGARIGLSSTGSGDFFTSDGNLTISTGSHFSVVGDCKIGSGGSGDGILFRHFFRGGATPVLLISNTAPTVVAGAGASITNSNGSCAFTIGLGAVASTGTITLPSAANGWCVYMQNVTHPDANVMGQTGFTQTTATFTNYVRTTGIAGNWSANDVAACIAFPF